MVLSIVVYSTYSGRLVELLGSDDLLLCPTYNSPLHTIQHIMIHERRSSEVCT
jgi:hypothetical protein